MLPEVLASITPRRRTPYNDLAVPIKVLEYLGYGRPLVVTDATETAAIVASAGCGVIVRDDAECTGIRDRRGGHRRAVADQRLGRRRPQGGGRQLLGIARGVHHEPAGHHRMSGIAASFVQRNALAARLTIVASIIMAAIAVAGSHLSMALFAVALGVLAVIAAYAALAWPRPVLVVVALSPIVDRYLAPGVLDVRVDVFVHFLSEGLLLIVGAVLVAQAIGRGTLRAALWHRTTAFLALFGLVAMASAIANAVSPAQAFAGILFTLDAAAFFVLARVVGFNERQATRAIMAFVVLMLLAATVAAGQALLSPNLFGLFALQGRFGEVYRLASFFGDPNVFAALLSAALPFTLFAIRGQPNAWRTARWCSPAAYWSSPYCTRSRAVAGSAQASASASWRSWWTDVRSWSARSSRRRCSSS